MKNSYLQYILKGDTDTEMIQYKLVMMEYNLHIAAISGIEKTTNAQCMQKLLGECSFVTCTQCM